MARGRAIKPSYFTDGDLLELEPLARLLFAGLWCWADRDGRLEDKPKDIKIKILPGDDADIDSLLSALSSKFITRYEIGNRRYIQINKFKEHQNPHKNEPESAIPPPSTGAFPEEYGASTVQAPDKYNTNPACIPVSLYPCIPVSSTPYSPPGDGVHESESLTVEMAQGIGEEPMAHSTTSIEQRFSEFWAIYPRKIGKGAAEKAWTKIRPSQKLHEIIMCSVEEAKSSQQWQKDDGQYIPNPANWLKQKRWEDELSKTAPSKPGTQHHVPNRADVERMKQLRDKLGGGGVDT